jgi:hypothetical protein
VRELQRICPSIQIDTTVVETSRGARAPGVLVITFADATVRGSRRRDNGWYLPLAETDAPNDWLVWPQGPVALPDGLTLRSPWMAFERIDSIGTIVVRQNRAKVRFAKWPRWIVSFPTSSDTVGQFSLAAGRSLLDVAGTPRELEINVSDDTK